MYIGFGTGCLGNIPLKEKAIWASKNGFKALEVACWPKIEAKEYSDNDIDVLNLTDKIAYEIRDYLKEFGLIISSLQYYENNLDRDLEKRSRKNKHLKRVIDAAVMLGTDMVGTFIGKNIDKDIKQNFDEFEKVFSDIIKYAEEREIKIIIENCPMEGWQIPYMTGTISFNPELWHEMFKRIPSPNFGLNYDPSHLHMQLIDYVEIIPLFKDRIFHVHAKDADVYYDQLKWYGIYNKQIDKRYGEGFCRYRMPGSGQLDWQKLITTLKSINYNGVLSIEHEDPEYSGTMEKIQKGLEISKNFLCNYII